ncbi:MAG: AraC family transcriptional regulator [Flavobacteriaceae bacterium]|nr:AraC family transcriptional regulator [Flavobacteriaceae bacterium]
MQLILLSFPIIITFILSVKLFIKQKNNSLSNKLLGLFFLFFGVALFAILFNYFIEYQPVLKNYLYLFEILFYSVMLSLPIIIYFYVISLTDYIKNYNTIWKIAPHFYIPIQSVLFNIYPYISTSTATNPKTLDYTNFFSLKIIFVLLNIIYITKTLITYGKHRSKLQDVLSYDKGISLTWISTFVLGYISFVLCFFLLTPKSSPYVVYIPLLLIITYFIFQRNTQISISLENYEGDLLDDTLLNIPSQTDLLEEKTNTDLDSDKKVKLKNEIIELMKSEKPFLKSELTIYQLARMLSTNTNYLSIVINNEFGYSFVSFINSYRINEAKQLLMNTDFGKYTIEAISEKSGFNSKSAFNRAFKKQTNITPSEFRNR